METENWMNKHLDFASSLSENRNQDRLIKLYDSYTKGSVPPVYPQKKEFKPMKPFRGKYRMQMRFVDAVGRVFDYENGNFKYLCSSIYIGAIQHEFSKNFDKFDYTTVMFKEDEPNRKH